MCVPAFDIPANGIDESCDGADARLLPVSATVSSTWRRSPRGARLVKLRALRMPAGGKVRLRCKGGGCPFKRKVVRGAGTLDLRKAVGSRRTLPDGAVLKVELSAPFTLAKTFSYRIRSGRIPRAVVRCAVAGGSERRLLT